MGVNGRRIKRRGSGRSGNSEELEASPAGSGEGSEQVTHLLESQKRVYEVGGARPPTAPTSRSPCACPQSSACGAYYDCVACISSSPLWITSPLRLSHGMTKSPWWDPCVRCCAKVKL